MVAESVSSVDFVVAGTFAHGREADLDFKTLFGVGLLGFFVTISVSELLSTIVDLGRVGPLDVDSEFGRVAVFEDFQSHIFQRGSVEFVNDTRKPFLLLLIKDIHHHSCESSVELGHRLIDDFVEHH